MTSFTDAQKTSPTFPPYTGWRIARFALFSRLVVLTCMAVSCSFLPDFHVGDDVLTFDLRLGNSSTDEMGDSLATAHDRRRCFCLAGHACDDALGEGTRADVRTQSTGGGIVAEANYDSGRRCAASDTASINDENRQCRFVGLDWLYGKILPPVTRWDAARFLTLSVDPNARRPPYLVPSRNFPGTVLSPGEGGIAGTTEGGNERCAAESLLVRTDERGTLHDDDRFALSEQAHAFFPLLPLLIRYCSIVLMTLIPPRYLPITFEATAALSAVVLNLVAFTIAAVCLYDVTLFMLLAQLDSNRSRSSSTNDQTKGVLTSTAKLVERDECARLAAMAAMLFCTNPAGVFFSSSYSESTFAMLTFAGHSVAARGRTSAGKSWYLAVAAGLWMAASYGRSNGTFSSIFLLLSGYGRVVAMVAKTAGNKHKRSHKLRGLVGLLLQCAAVATYHISLAALVAFPFYYHDWRGFHAHCDVPSLYQPSWCDLGDSDRSHFSLYAYVQREHWNVGWMRYYQWKQVPNFLLAAPMLTISLAATSNWIFLSWTRYDKCQEQRCLQPKKENYSETKPKGDERVEGGGPHTENVATSIFCWPLVNLVQWAYFAFRESATFNSTSTASATFCSTKDSCEVAKKGAECSSRNFEELHLGRRKKDPASLLLSPVALPDYALLGGFLVIGAFVAHVQIFTRMMCSSCPSLYWYITVLILRSEGTYRLAMTVYFSLYNFLGVLMHVNWLPWT